MSPGAWTGCRSAQGCQRRSKKGPAWGRKKGPLGATIVGNRGEPSGEFRLKEYTRRLGERGISFKERDVPGQALHQLFLKDPDGVTIEINFRDEAAA